MKRNKIFWVLLYSTASFFLFIIDVRAYIDPSVLTYAIQAIAGIVIALSTVAGVYFSRIRRTFHIEAEEKESESDFLTFHDPNTGKTITTQAAKAKESGLDDTLRKKERKPRKSSLLAGVLITIAVSFLWTVYSPLMLYLNNTREFLFDVYSIFPAIMLYMAVFTVAGLLVFLFSRAVSDKAYVIVCGLGLAFLIICYVQGNFLADGLPPMDGRQFEWGLYGAEKIKSYLLIAVTSLLVIFAAVRLKRRRFLMLANGISLFLMLVMAVTAVNIGIQKNGFSRRMSASVTAAHMLDMSSEKNAVIFMVDAVDSALFREIMETEDPEYREWFRDFTYYPNTVGSYTYTSHAVPFVLTGKWMENQEDFASFETKSMDESPLLKTLQEQGYRLGLYEDQLTYESDGIYRFENVADDHYRLNSIGEYIRQSFYVTWFQYMPYPLKPLFSREDAFENIQNRAVGQEEPFIGSNTLVYERIREEDFTISEQPCFRFIHIEGAHVPFQHDKDANEIPREQGSYPQSIQASATIVHAYLEKMKAAGIFDSSVIIVMADHGFVYSDNVDGIKGRSNPLLMVKGRNESHELTVSEQPVSHEDLQEMYQKLLAGEKTDALFDFKEGEQRNRRFLGFNYNDPDTIIEYVQTGYASDYDAMIETGTVYQFQK